MKVIRAINQIAEAWAIKVAMGLFATTAFVTFYLCYIYAFGYTKIEREVVVYPQVSLSVLGQGPLSLTRTYDTILGDLIKEFVLVGANTRPDQDHDRACTLALRSSGAKSTVHVGETVFLDHQEGKLVFSDHPTNLTIIPRHHEDDHLICEMKREEISESFTLSSSSIFSEVLDHKPFVEILKKGAVWGKDVFLSGWGGDEYRDMTSKAKISIGSDVLFLKAGDVLFWDGRGWTQEMVSDEMVPIAQVVKASMNGADIQVWDETGFTTKTVHIDLATSPKSFFKMDELMTAIRPRSSSEITCQLGKRRVIVREGDWWIKSNDRWRPVRTSGDLEACLRHQIPGELFIFEKVEASQGNVVLQARAFDWMRTSSEPVSIVLQTEKKKSPSSKRSTGTTQIAKNRSSRMLTSSGLANSQKEDL